MSPRLDLTAQRYGRWTVLRYAGARGAKRMWLCRCECGGEHEVEASNLRGGRSVQCRACSHRGTPIIYGRTSRNAADWARVLGVSPDTVQRRLKRFPAEIALQAKLPPPGAGKSGHFITFRGTTLNIAGWAARLGLTRQALSHRLSMLSVEESLTRPAAKTRPRKTSYVETVGD